MVMHVSGHRLCCKFDLFLEFSWAGVRGSVN